MARASGAALALLSLALLSGLPSTVERSHAAGSGGQAILTGWVEVDVVDGREGQGILGALVVALDAAGGSVARGFSGDGGRAVLNVAAGGPYTLRAETMGYAPALSDTFRILPGDSLRLPPLRLEADGQGARERVAPR